MRRFSCPNTLPSDAFSLANLNAIFAPFPAPDAESDESRSPVPCASPVRALLGIRDFDVILSFLRIGWYIFVTSALPNPVDEHRSQGLVTQRGWPSQKHLMWLSASNRQLPSQTLAVQGGGSPQCACVREKEPERSPPPKLDKLRMGSFEFRLHRANWQRILHTTNRLC